MSIFILFNFFKHWISDFVGTDLNISWQHLCFNFWNSLNSSIGFHFIISQKHIHSSSAYKYYSYSFDLSVVITVFINFKLSYSRSLFFPEQSHWSIHRNSLQEHNFTFLKYWIIWWLSVGDWCIASHRKKYTEFFLSTYSSTVLEQVLPIQMTHHQVWPFKFFLLLMPSILAKITFFSCLQNFCWS